MTSWSHVTFAVATDGSEKYDIAASAMAFCIDESRVQHGTWLPIEDCIAFVAELAGFVLALSAVAKALTNCIRDGMVVDQQSLVLLYDSKAARQFVVSPKCVFRAEWKKRINDLVNECEALGLTVVWWWIPAHGKEAPRWSPPPGMTSEFVRSLNDDADKAAGRARSAAYRLCSRKRWHDRLERERKWACDALYFAAGVHAKYEEHLRALVARL